jgi:transposase InsO family protein
MRARAESARRPSLALSEAERQAVLDVVHQPRFINRSVPTIQATLLDEGTYCCSKSTMYRILHDSNEVGERRAQACRPAYVKPELCATEPNRVWAWDITKLHGPQKWTYYYLYVVIDIYSRNVVGWLLADRESSELARVLLAETICKEGVNPKLLTIHADRGSSMGSKPVAFLLADLGEAGPVPWRLSVWRRRIHPWPENAHERTRWNSGLRSSSSPALGDDRRISPPSSKWDSRQSGIGLSKQKSTPARATMVLHRVSVKKWRGFENAFGNSKPNGTYCQKPRLGSLARPIRYLRSLRIRESASSPLASCHAVPRAGSLVQRVLRVAQSPALDESTSGHRDRRRS